MSVGLTTRVARRIFSKYLINGFVSTEAYVESRLPQTGHSVDLLWSEQIKKNKKYEMLADCAKICLEEGHEVAGWQIIEKRRLTEKRNETPVSDVIATPTDTNKRHGSMLLRSALELSLQDDGENKFKIQIAAKLLKGFFESTSAEGFMEVNPEWLKPPSQTEVRQSA